MKLTRESFAARKAAVAKVNNKGVDLEKEIIKKAGGMVYHHVVPSRTQSNFVVGGSKALHKQTGGDKFSQQARYAKAMQ